MPQIRHIIAVGIPVYVAAWAAVALLPIPANDTDAFFWPSARVALAGHPLQIYQPLGHGLYPNANGPLSMAPLVLVGTVVRAIESGPLAFGYSPWPSGW